MIFSWLRRWFPYSQIMDFSYIPGKPVESGLIKLYWQTTRTQEGKKQLVYINNGVGFVRKSNAVFISVKKQNAIYKVYAISWKGVDVKTVKLSVQKIITENLQVKTAALAYKPDTYFPYMNSHFSCRPVMAENKDVQFTIPDMQLSYKLAYKLNHGLKLRITKPELAQNK